MLPTHTFKFFSYFTDESTAHVEDKDFPLPNRITSFINPRNLFLRPHETLSIRMKLPSSLIALIGVNAPEPTFEETNLRIVKRLMFLSSKWTLRRVSFWYCNGKCRFSIFFRDISCDWLLRQHFQLPTVYQSVYIVEGHTCKRLCQRWLLFMRCINSSRQHVHCSCKSCSKAFRVLLYRFKRCTYMYCICITRTCICTV